MRLAVIGDVHHHMERLRRVLAHIDALGCDGVLQVGDIGGYALGRRSPDRHPELVAEYQRSVDAVLDEIRKLGVPLFWVPGNHDVRGVAGRGNVETGLGEIGGLRIAGIGGAGPDRFGFPYEWEDNHIRQRVIPDCDVLLCHAPPANTPLDLVPHRNEHVGSWAIRELAERHRGVLVCGHIHESPGVVMLEECLCLNAGGLGEPWGSPRVGFVEDLEFAWVEDLATGWRQELQRTQRA
ncbi:MAG TPA: metallophosphoesterase family protein [Myxococcota bacterium]|nr:metallophosphoesterase family protein [Myxococcota bacterium]